MAWPTSPNRPISSFRPLPNAAPPGCNRLCIAYAPGAVELPADIGAEMDAIWREVVEARVGLSSYQALRAALYA
jgi:hypothetical protein